MELREEIIIGLIMITGALILFGVLSFLSYECFNPTNVSNVSGQVIWSCQ